MRDDTGRRPRLGSALVLEDDVGLASAIADILDDAGYHAVAVKTVAEAVAAMERSKPDVDRVDRGEDRVVVEAQPPAALRRIDRREPSEAVARFALRRHGELLRRAAKCVRERGSVLEAVADLARERFREDVFDRSCEA